LEIIDKDLTVNGDIILNGTCKSSVSSPGKIEWNKDKGTLDGTGTFSNIDELDTNTGNKTILATANITFTNTSIDGEDNDITNNGIVNISGPNGFADGSKTTITWINIGTLNYGVATFWAALNASSTANTVNYIGDVQTVKATTYNNLTLSGSGTKTFTGNTTIANELSIASGVVANLGAAFTHTTAGLSLGGVDQIAGSWGGIASAAINKNAVFFTSFLFLIKGIINNSDSVLPKITIQPSPLTICENTGGTFIVVTSDTSATYQWQYSGDNTNWTNIDATLNPNPSTYVAGFTSATLTLTNTPANWVGNYVRCVVTNTGKSTKSTSVLLTVNSSATPATKTWNGTSWSPIGAPTGNQNIAFAGNYAVNADVVACTCTVTSGVVIIPTGKNLILGSKLTVSGGSLTFQNNASLLQTTYTGANSGAIIYNRDTPKIINTDYTYWSSPVAAGYTLGQLSPNTLAEMYYSYDADIENWRQESSATKMNVGVGYIVRGPEPTPPLPPTQVSFSASFKGEPNNGTIPVTISYKKAVPDLGTSNLIGNPYPSAIDANAFLSANLGVIDGTLYFWTHNTGRNNGQYNSNDYASLNGTGGAAGTGGVVPSGQIAAGQGFFTTGIAPGTVKFNNTMRVTGNNSQFFKTKKPNGKTANNIEKNRVWLNLTNTEGAFKQILIGYVTDATNDYDSRFDGDSFDGNEFVDFYSLNQDRNLVIQGRALPFDDADEVPLGFRTTIDGTFTIKIDQVDGLLTNQAVFLEDKLTNTVTDLKSADYAFTTTAGTFDERFVLKYTNKTLRVDAMDKEDGILVLYSNNYKTLIIHNNVWNSTVNTVDLYNITGQKISNWDVKDSEQTTIQIPIQNMSSGIYIVKVNTTKGESSKKIIVN
jgi:hypothetical protein